MTDPVNAPAHYQSTNGVECIEAIKAAMTTEEFFGYLRGNCIKYIWRFRQKDALLLVKTSAKPGGTYAA
jgi:hypothetical protein